ncbi:MAG TPA: hypothetical protein ENL20_02065 [Candidatus Cloacimonetes bacterium]|nr:hypothetical protein [Candidatus Cloacimonadota bacterium]
MKKLLFVIIFVNLLFSSIVSIYAQNCDLLYFCVSYDPDAGEIDCSDRFTTGNITVVALLKSPIFYTKITIQVDKYNPREGTFEYYDAWEFDVDPEMDFIYFNDINFQDKGFFRVFLVDPEENIITSGLVEIT